MSDIDFNVISINSGINEEPEEESASTFFTLHLAVIKTSDVPIFIPAGDISFDLVALTGPTGPEPPEFIHGGGVITQEGPLYPPTAYVLAQGIGSIVEFHIGASVSYFGDTYGISRSFCDFDTRQILSAPSSVKIKFNIATPHMGSINLYGGGGAIQIYKASWEEPIVESYWDIGTLSGTAAGPFEDEIEIDIDPSDIVLGGISQFAIRFSPANAPSSYRDNAYKVVFMLFPELVVT